MKKIVMYLGFLVGGLTPTSSFSQWAVYDEEVKKQLVLVNKTKKLTGFESTAKTYDHYEASQNDRGDVTMGTGQNAATLKSLETKFEDVTELPELTPEKIKKYVGTEADCGQQQVSPKHWEACVGLRNLRLQTLVQSHAMLKNVFMRRGRIEDVIKKARTLPEDESNSSLGQLQRATFEIQGQIALMQVDALQIQLLMDGYRQREALYMTQQAEARKAMLSQAQFEKNPRPPKFVPLIKVGPSN